MDNENFTDDEDSPSGASNSVKDDIIQRNANRKLLEEEQIFRLEQFERRSVEIRKTVLFVLIIFAIVFLYYFASKLALEALSILQEIKIITLKLPKEEGQISFTSPIDWHVIFIITSFLIPPTILSYMLIKGVYGITKGSDTPVGEILTQVKETVENVKGIAEALTRKSKD